ncbi:MAG: DUF2934 domain-containing protein [Blastocatellia bacterium]
MKPRKKHDELLEETPARTSRAKSKPAKMAAENLPAMNEQSRLPDPEELIRQRAWEIYQSRGDGSGDALSDWFQAEAEVRAAIGTPEQDMPELQKPAGTRKRAAAGGEQSGKTARSTKNTADKRPSATR